MKKNLTFLTLALSAFTSYAQQYSREIEIKIKKVEQNLGLGMLIVNRPRPTLQERMAFHHIKGLSIAVIHNYKMEWARSYGWADSAGHRPVTTQTLFQAASVSKSLNALGVLRLAQEGKLDIYTDINTYLTGWKFPYDSVSKGKKITLANLLSHTGGLSIHGFPSYAVDDSLPPIELMLDGKTFPDAPAVRSVMEPGISSLYSGGGVTISQLIIMNVSHESYERYMYDKVLAPLGMTNSSFIQRPAAAKRQLLATGYQMDGKELEGKYRIHQELAGAGLWTNPTDLCKYVIETELSYRGLSAKILDQTHTRLMLTPYIDSSMGLGVMIDTVRGEHYFQHSGASEGFRCQYMGTINGGEGVVVMVNSDNAAIIPELINSVATVYDWKKYYEPATKTIVSLSPAELQACAGKYKSRDGKPLFVEISATKDRLILHPSWIDIRSSLFPDSTSSFFDPETGMPLKVIRDPNGHVGSVLINDTDYWDRVID